MAKHTPPCELIAVGNILSYDDGEDKGAQTVRIRDHGSSEGAITTSSLRFLILIAKTIHAMSG